MIVVLADKGIVCSDCRIVPWWMHHPEPSLLCDPNKRNQPKPNQLVLPGNQANETNRNQTNETNQMNQMNQMNQISFNSWKLRHELFIRMVDPFLLCLYGLWSCLYGSWNVVIKLPMIVHGEVCWVSDNTVKIANSDRDKTRFIYTNGRRPVCKLCVTYVVRDYCTLYHF